MLMKKISILLFLLLIFDFSAAQAGSIEKCVDNTGKVTYTDKGCKGKETAEDTYVPGRKSRNPADKTTMVGFKVSEIGVLTDQAATLCAKQAIKYFAESNTEMEKNASSEFTEIKDRSLKGVDVQIVLEGVVRYKNKGKKQELEKKLLCTASKSRNSDWVLAFKNTASNAADTKVSDN